MCNDYEDLVVTNPGACCEEFACRCNPNKCPLPAVCALNQRRVRVNNDTECCAVYKCECKSGVLHPAVTRHPWRSVVDVGAPGAIHSLQIPPNL
uniref:Otogelin-like protein isoform X1 n=1 Tax=Petromyzon marinus TaxID=7757 RepID=A0AAJ7SYW0_PETMA|nr:otogelin-like protein isoform X1 [Petromyzon marinus]